MLCTGYAVDQGGIHIQTADVDDCELFGPTSTLSAYYIFHQWALESFAILNSRHEWAAQASASHQQSLERLFASTNAVFIAYFFLYLET
jgi:hypothetical protein